MDITLHIEAIQQDLAAAAALGDERVAEAGERLAAAVEASLRLRVIDLLGEAALALNAQLPEGHVEVRIAGRDPELVVVAEDIAPDEAPAPGDDLSARITLRLPEALKGQLEAAAAREGISANAWIVRALARSIDQRPAARRSGNRLQGYARG